MIDGLPAHVLLVHFIVVGLPLAALMLVASAVWPAARRRLGFLSPLVALGVLVLVPVTTSAGHWLIKHDFGPTPPPNALHHEHLGDWVWTWAAGIFLMSALVWLLGRREDARGTASAAGPSGVRTATVPRWATAGLAVLSVAVAVGGVYWVFLTGEAGAHLVFGG